MAMPEEVKPLIDPDTQKMIDDYNRLIRRFAAVAHRIIDRLYYKKHGTNHP